VVLLAAVPICRRGCAEAKVLGRRVAARMGRRYIVTTDWNVSLLGRYAGSEYRIWREEEKRRRKIFKGEERLI
jgi:hypothetical protein